MEKNITQNMSGNMPDLYLLLENPYLGLIFVDVNGTIQFVNESMAKYNNLSSEKMLGNNVNIFNIDETINHVLQTQEYMFFQKFEKLDRTYIASRYPVYDPDKNFVGVCAWYFSISPKDVNRKFGSEYNELIERLQIDDIWLKYKRTIMELNSYKEYYNENNQPRKGVRGIIGKDPKIIKLKRDILNISNSPSSVLITGESGTGKELVAQALHFHGNRAKQPFIKINCAAIPESLIESELFGYSDGAFTGARKGGKMGKFEMANNGTIFLDEIGDMSLEMQAKILRVLQEREIERIGGESSIPIDVRLITATNRNLVKMVRNDEFREDLFYRINIINIKVPPLRERKGDIEEIANHVISQFNKQLNKSIKGIEPDAMERIMEYDWPGNIRELINSIESAMNFCQSDFLGYEDFYYSVARRSGHSIKKQSNDMQTNVDQVTKKHLLTVLEQCNGNRKETAKQLNVSKSTLYRMMKKYDLIDYSK